MHSHDRSKPLDDSTILSVLGAAILTWMQILFSSSISPRCAASGSPSLSSTLSLVASSTRKDRTMRSLQRTSFGIVCIAIVAFSARVL